MPEKLPDTSSRSLETLRRFCIVVVFSIAFGYIEASVVVYLRAIFHPAGFTFPLTNFGTDTLLGKYILTEIGREVATIVLILTGSWLFGRNLQQRFAYFLAIFAVWDIFYYVWLKLLLDWPGSIMDWDVLFLIPIAWASPVLAPILISLTLLVFAVIILYRCCCKVPIKLTLADWIAFTFAALVVVVSLCTAGPHITEPDYKSHFHWPLFALGYILAIALFTKCLLKSKQRT